MVDEILVPNTSDVSSTGKTQIKRMSTEKIEPTVNPILACRALYVRRGRIRG